MSGIIRNTSLKKKEAQFVAKFELMTCGSRGMGSAAVLQPLPMHIKHSFQLQLAFPNLSFPFQEKFFDNPSQVTLQRQGSVLRFVISLPQHSGKYECQAANRAGSLKNFVVLNVEESYTTPKGLVEGIL